MPRIILVLCNTLLLASCSSIEDLTGNNPIIDTQGVNFARYDVDLRQCQDYADEVAIAQQAGSGTITGAVVGGVFGAVIGDSDTAKKGAGIGAIGGAVRGVGDGMRERERVIKRCLMGRGYRVLN